MIRNVKIAVFALAGLAVAAAAALQAWGVSSWRADPLAAASMWPANGEARGKVAEGLLNAQLSKTEGQLVGKVSPEAVRMARLALRADPRNADALLVIAYAIVGVGDLKTAREIFTHIATQTKRDRKANAWLAQYYLRNEEIETSLYYLDLVLRSGQDTRDQVIPVIVDALQREAILPAVQRLLEDDPPWAPRFWQIATQNSASLPKVGSLRRSVGVKNTAVAYEDDERLVSQLVARGEIEEARRVVAYLTSEGEGESVLNDAGFDSPARYAPIGWRLASEGDYGATIYPEDSVMVVSALPGAFGVAASQLIRLKPGTYALELMAESEVPDGLKMTAWVRCDGQQRPNSRIVLEPKKRRVVGNVAGDCPDAWLEIQVQAASDADPEEIVLERIMLVRR